LSNREAERLAAHIAAKAPAALGGSWKEGKGWG
jgi:hypothetical protein